MDCFHAEVGILRVDFAQALGIRIERDEPAQPARSQRRREFRFPQVTRGDGKDIRPWRREGDLVD